MFTRYSNGGIPMVKIQCERTALVSFLSSFGNHVEDMRIECAGGRLTVEVAYSKYYIRKQMVGVTVVDEGAIHIATLTKALKFLKASKSDTVTIRQTAPTKPLHIEIGGNKLQLPSTDDIESAAKAVIVRELLKNSHDNNWTKFSKDELIAHGSIHTKDLLSLSGMGGLVAKESQFVMRVHCGEDEFGIVAGKASSGRIFTSIPVKDTDGPAATVQTSFGEWLPTCLSNLDEGVAQFHMGNDTIVIFEQDNATLLVVNEVGDE